MPATPKTSILFFVFTLLGFSAFAQPLTISGRLIEQNSQTLTGQTRSLANLSLLIDGKTVKTDPNGYFSLKVNDKNRVGYLQLDSKEYQIINQEALEQALSCTQDNTIELQVEVGKTRTLSANFSRFYQQLRLQMGQTEVQWFQLFYAGQTDSLATLLGNAVNPAVIDRAFLRELFHNLEPQMEYWANRLAMINLDHHAPDFRSAYQQLRAGQTTGLDEVIRQLAEKKDLRISGIKDLLMSWYLANGKFGEAADILNKHKEQETVLPSALIEQYRLGMLTRSFDAIMGTDEQLLNTVCREGPRFLALSRLTELFAEQMDFRKARTNYEAAQLLWEEELDKHSDRYAPAYARMLINMGILHYQQSNAMEARTLVRQAIDLFERLSQEQPALYEPDFMRAQTVLSTFYLIYNNDYEQALRILDPTLLLAQRLSRQTPQLYLSEVADLYLWKARCHQQLKDYDLAISTYLLATNYYESQAMQNPMELESVCNGYLLVAEAYSQQLNQTNDPTYRVKGLEVVQKGMQKANVWKRYDVTGADMMMENLKYFEDIFRE
jgi:hypothetical protein